MSHYVTPFLVLNLGSEMVFVIAQRLQAQNISAERAGTVLDEIISVLISNQLITELMKPQTTYNNEAIREIIEDVTQSSAMRLDTISMGKLWDLITMVFKWQITIISKGIIQLTLRHLYEIENYVINLDTQLHKIQNLIENFNKILTNDEKDLIRNEVIDWLKDCNVRVSLLLRMGLQNMDGQFIVNNLDPIAEDMLKNLGENIYAVTQNGRILEEKNRNHQFAAAEGETTTKSEPEVNELQLFVDQMIGEKKVNEKKKLLRLAITNESSILGTSNNNNNNNEEEEERGGGGGGMNVTFDGIEVDVEGQKLDELMNDITIIADSDIEESCLKDDLLELIGGGEDVIDK